MRRALAAVVAVVLVLLLAGCAPMTRRDCVARGGRWVSEWTPQPNRSLPRWPGYWEPVCKGWRA